MARNREPIDDLIDAHEWLRAKARRRAARKPTKASEPKPPLGAQNRMRSLPVSEVGANNHAAFAAEKLL